MRTHIFNILVHIFLFTYHCTSTMSTYILMTVWVLWVGQWDVQSCSMFNIINSITINSQLSALGSHCLQYSSLSYCVIYLVPNSCFLFRRMVRQPSSLAFPLPFRLSLFCCVPCWSLLWVTYRPGLEQTQY